MSDKVQTVEYAKFLQNILLENNINCFLVGGALINSVRDHGVLHTDDIDFAILCDDIDFDMKTLIKIFENYITFNWSLYPSYLAVCPIHEGYDNIKIDFFKFVKRNLNYYINDANWIHERISHFQTFKHSEVILENKNFVTMYRPELFLKTVYGDYFVKRDEYHNQNGGDTQHLHGCIYYADVNNFDSIDFKVENLKLFFRNVLVKTDLVGIDETKINVFDRCHASNFDQNKILLYKDFTNYLIKHNITFKDF
jgi:hypothetical protein